MAAAIARPPIPSLRPFVKLIWASREQDQKRSPGTSQERLLPTGSTHLAFRLSENPIRIFDSPADKSGSTFRFGVVGGIRSSSYIKDIARSAATVGALLHPGAAQLLFRHSSEELANRHTAIEDLWGRDSVFLWEQFHEVETPEKQLALFEAFLAARLPQVSGVHPAIAHALGRMAGTDNIAAIVEETGYSHRRFIELFKRNVGLSPRLYCRLARFQHALKVTKASQIPLINIALQAGYSDQAHFNREFREFSGMTPSEYLISSRGDTFHVPLSTRK